MALTKVPSNLDATIATTQSASDNSTNVATTAYVTTALANLSDSAPAALNTLNEIAAALGDDANYASTTTAAIAAKAPLASPSFTGTVQLLDTNVPDNRAIRFGSSQDLQIHHDGTNSHIINNTGYTTLRTSTASGYLYLHGDNVQFRGQSANEPMITAVCNGPVKLYYDNSIKLETTTNGISAKGISSNLITTSSTANDRAGAGFTATESATDGDRKARMYLDADNGAFSTGNSGAYFYIEKKGGGGEVSLINQDTSDMYFQTGGSHKRITIQGGGDVLIGTTSNNYNRGKFTVFGTPGNPATTGNNSDNVAIRVATNTGNSQSFDIGMYNSGDYGAWLQASNSGSLNSHSPIVLNPNGGNVGIGVVSPSSTLDVAGNIKVSDGYFEFDKPSVKGFRILHNDIGNDLSFQQGDTNNANYVTRLNINTDGKVGIGVSPTRTFTVKSAAANATQISLVDNDSTNEVFAVGQQSDGDGFLTLNQDDGTTKVLFDASGDSYVAGGPLHIGSTDSISSSSEIFSVYSPSTGHTKLVNNSDSYGTVYMHNESTTANTFQPSIIIQKGGGNRGNIGVRHSDSVLGISGQGGISLRTANSSLEASTEGLFIDGDRFVTVGSESLITKSQAGFQIKKAGLLINGCSSSSSGISNVNHHSNYWTFFGSSGTSGSVSGSFRVSVPSPTGTNGNAWGGFQLEIYISGYSGKFCHAMLSGYTNGGVTLSESTIVRSSGSHSVSYGAYHTGGSSNQGFYFDINIPSYTHPSAFYRITKAGDTSGDHQTNLKNVVAEWS